MIHRLVRCIAGLTSLAFTFLFSAHVYSGVINFTSFEAQVAENDSALTVNITRTGAVGQAASVTIVSESLSAKSPADFTAISTTLNWAAGESDSKPIEIAISDDRLIEGNEKFRLLLKNPVGDIIGAFKTQDITITDFEEGSVSFKSAVFSASETDGTLTVQLIRTGGTDGEITATLKSADGSASKGLDYSEVNAVVTFVDGQVAAEVFIGLIDDQIAELEERFKLTISDITGNALLGSLSESVAKITDLDNDVGAYSSYIDPSSEYVSKSVVLDLRESKFDESNNFLNLINNISLFKTSKISLSQLPNGLVRTDVGDSAYFFWPTEITRNVVSQASSVLIVGGDSPRLYTDHNFIITLQPALGGLNTLQEWLAGLGIPEILVANSGSITVRTYQGPPSFETKANGEIVLSNAYFDRWTLRPEGPAIKVNFAYEGVQIESHPIYPNDQIVAVYFKDNTDYRRQLLSPAPYDPLELEEKIESKIGFRDVRFAGFGVIEFSVLTESILFPGASSITVMSDYIVRRNEKYEVGDSNFTPYIDVNGDGLVDFKMIYSTGDEQIFYTKSYN